MQHGPRYNWSMRMVHWGCSDCAWVLRPSGPAVGNTFDEMTVNFVAQRDFPKEGGPNVGVHSAQGRTLGLVVPYLFSSRTLSGFMCLFNTGHVQGLMLLPDLLLRCEKHKLIA